MKNLPLADLSAATTLSAPCNLESNDRSVRTCSTFHRVPYLCVCVCVCVWTCLLFFSLYLSRGFCGSCVLCIVLCDEKQFKRRRRRTKRIQKKQKIKTSHGARKVDGRRGRTTRVDGCASRSTRGFGGSSRGRYRREVVERRKETGTKGNALRQVLQGV